MKGNTGEVHIGSEGELYKCINPHAGTQTKVRSKNKVELEVPEYMGEVIKKDKS